MAIWLRIGVGISVAASLSAQISGRVVANGGPPPERAFVTVHCEGPATWNWSGYTDNHGEFVSSVPDGRANFDGDFDDGVCQITATVRGFHRGVAETRHTRQSNVIVTLTALAGGGEATIRYADLTMPAAARKLFDDAAGDMQARRWKAAEAKLRKALAACPSFAAAWNQLGVALQSSGKLDAAADAYAKAFSLDPLLFAAAARLAILQAGQQRWDQVLATTTPAISREPVEWPSLFFYNAVANYNLGRLDDAARSATRAADLQFARAHYILGMVLAAQGHARRAADEMSRYLELMPNAADAEHVRTQIQELAARTGK